MVPAPQPFPLGNYELTLRSKLPDGTLATSKEGVVIALDAVASSSGALQSHAEVPFNVPETAAANRCGRTLPFHSCRTRPPLYQMEAHRPPRSSPRLRPRLYPVATACGASALRRRHAIRSFVYKANRDRIRGSSHESALKAEIAVPALRGSIVMECLALRTSAIPPKAGADREAADVQKVPSKAEVSQPLFFAALACNRTESETTTSNAGLPYSVR